MEKGVVINNAMEYAMGYNNNKKSLLNKNRTTEIQIKLYRYIT